MKRPKTVLSAAALAALAFSTAVPGLSAPESIPRRYLLPVWYTAQVEPVQEGGRVQVRARVQPGLAPMRDARIFIEPGKGLRVVAARVVTAPEPGASWRADDGAIVGDLHPGKAYELEATLEPVGDAERAYVTLAFDYRFPDQEIIDHVKKHREDLYPDDELRQLLLKAILEHHRGRQSGGVTRRIELAR